jgi:hypothetical protein
MPKKKHPETPEEQAKRFKSEVEKLIADGELDPEKADAKMEELIGNIARERSVNR